MTTNNREMEELKDAFNLYDMVGDGMIESANLGAVLRAVGENPTEAEVRKAVQLVDPDKNKRISFEEFVPVLMSVRSRRTKANTDDFIDSLKVFDNDSSGLITSGELRHVLTSLGEKISDAEYDVLLQGLEDNQGQVNYEEFVKAVMSG